MKKNPKARAAAAVKKGTISLTKPTSTLNPSNGKPGGVLKPMHRMSGGSGLRPSREVDGDDYLHTNETAIGTICLRLQQLQKSRVVNLKTRIMIGNRLRAAVATEIGYHAGMEEDERKAQHKKAQEIIDAIAEGKYVGEDHQELVERVGSLVIHTLDALRGFDEITSATEKKMENLARQLPVYTWAKTVRGFCATSSLTLAKVVGESGDLLNYPNPGKLWRRFGLAPYNGKMPGTWKRGKEGKISSEEWEELGYSPRRRSQAYLIGELLMKLNDGVYRQQYDTKKADFKQRNPEYPDMRCHLHGMLCATKMLLRDLWIQWNGSTKNPNSKSTYQQ